MPENNKSPNGKTNLDCQLQLMRSFMSCVWKVRGRPNVNPPGFGREPTLQTCFVGLVCQASL